MLKMIDNEKRLADVLRQARKRSLTDLKCTSEENPQKELSEEIEKYRTDNGSWPSAKVREACQNNVIPVSLQAEVLSLAIKADDIKSVKLLLSSARVEIGDFNLVDTLLLALSHKDSDLMQTVLNSRINHGPVVARLRSKATAEDCVSLIEEAASLVQQDPERMQCNTNSVFGWVQAIVDSHFFGFAQRLGFTESDEGSSDNVSVKSRLEKGIELLLASIDDRLADTAACQELLSLVETSVAVATNRLPNVSRYRSSQGGKTHREYAVRLIRL